MTPEEPEVTLAEEAPEQTAPPAAEAAPGTQPASDADDAGGSEPQPAAAAAPSEEPAAQEAPGPATAPGTSAALAESRPAVPGADLEVDIVPEGVDPLAAGPTYSYDEDGETEEPVEVELIEEVVTVEPIEAVAIDLGAGARYRATGKRKTAIARVTLRPGSGSYTINGRPLDAYFPRETLQRNIRQPLETVGYEERMDVVARMHGGGVSAQAGALRHGISRALLEADPNLRGELKRRGFLTRDARAKERKKAGLKKARKRPQFSKR
jgi:small subunit ribosomal protein S9